MIRKTFIFLLIAICFSCEKQAFFFNCSECLSTDPINASLFIKLHVDYNVGPIAINIYEGNLEDRILYRSLSSSQGTRGTKVTVAINKKYTVTASFNRLGNLYIAVDSATPRVKYDEDQCENPCYFIYDNRIDLRIRHY